MSIKLTFQIILSSDYHIGAGYGKGANLDSALLRDADGIPVIRGTALSGLLRDSMYQLLQNEPMAHLIKCVRSGVKEGKSYCGQGGHNGSVDSCPICRLFGTPRSPKHWKISSARPGKISSARPVGQLQPGFGVLNEPGQVDQHVRIDPRTRRAQPRKLFTEESWFEKQGFQFTIQSDAQDENILDEAALWIAAARNLRQLGRARQRGQGQCVVHLVSLENNQEEKPNEGECDEVALLRKFESVWLLGKPATTKYNYLNFQPQEQSRTTQPADGSTTTDKSVRVRIIVRLDEPLLIARRAEAGNQFESQLVISGQTLRGALAWRAAGRFEIRSGTSAYPSFVQNFVRDQASFPWLLPAKFESGVLRPTLFAPGDMLTCKLYPEEPPGGHGIFFGTRSPITCCPTCGSALKEVTGFVVLYEDWRNDTFLFRPQRSTEMHIRIDPNTGRVASGDLFGYVALDSGQYFVGDLLCKSASAWGELKMLCGITEKKAMELQFGKAFRRGYGKATVWFEALDLAEDTWRPKISLEDEQESGGDSTTGAEIIAGQAFQLTLLTDTLILDDWGRAIMGFEKEWLSHELGIPIIEVRAVCTTHTVDGFSAQLGLPRWRDLAIKAGSTARLRSSETISLDKRCEIERKGIGLRSAEGFGRVAIDHPVYDKCQGILTSIQIPEDLGLTTHPNSRFIEEWTKELAKEKWSFCADSRFSAVARWLNAYQASNPNDLAEQINKLGEPGQSLITDITNFGSREKDNKLQANERGIQLVRDVLNRLVNNYPEHTSQGIHLLANFIAEASRPKRE